MIAVIVYAIGVVRRAVTGGWRRLTRTSRRVAARAGRARLTSRAPGGLFHRRYARAARPAPGVARTGARHRAVAGGWLRVVASRGEDRPLVGEAELLYRFRSGCSIRFGSQSASPAFPDCSGSPQPDHHIGR